MGRRVFYLKMKNILTNSLLNIKYFDWFILLGSTYELVLYVQTSYNGFFLQAL